MNKPDPAEDKLIASIKKTRSDSQSSTKKKSKSTAGKTSSTQTRPKKTSTGQQKQALIDLFQYGRRVWPD